MERLEAIWQQMEVLADAGLFKVGQTSISLNSLLKLVIFAIIAVWVSKAARLGLNRVLKGRAATPSTLYTLDRLSHYTILTFGFVLGLSAVGIDFTTFAVVAGALGLGVGLGLQPLVGSFVSGIILLIERTLRVGDFIELESGIMGEVRQINIRSTMITTNDNVDVLIPNSQFITGRVINWTLQEEVRRIHIPFGVAYGADKERVRAAALEAASRVPADVVSLPERPPQVWFVRFGESSLDFELLVWLGASSIRRPKAVTAAYLWELHSALERHGIEVPFPQRDLHLKSYFGLSGETARNALASRHEPPR